MTKWDLFFAAAGICCVLIGKDMIREKNDYGFIIIGILFILLILI